jgi:acetylornithine deacetylase/succinyl-diaminopimelate desuccinylase-like protein
VRRRWLSELGEFLAFPTISALPSQRPHLEAAARWLRRHLAGLGLQNAEILPGPNGAPPSVYADWLNAPQQPVLLLYGHYDVQPPGPLSEWRTPPFRATIIGDSLFARGASDDKGQLFVHLKAIESYLGSGKRLPVNVKVWIEGEEEVGSPNLEALLRRERDRLRADAMLVLDTEMVKPGRPSIVYGLRGRLGVEIEVRSPAPDLHAGRYGGAAANPLQALCSLIASLHDRRGRIAVPGLYDAVREVAPFERRALASSTTENPWALTGWGELGYTAGEQRTIRPALTLTDMEGGARPGGRAAIPSRAIAKLDLRLVPNQEPCTIAWLLRRSLVARLPRPLSCRIRFSGSSGPVIISRGHPAMRAAGRAVRRTWGLMPLFVRSGGSIPAVEKFQRLLGVSPVLLSLGLPDDQIHAPNEKLNLSNFFRGVDTVVAFLEECAR